MTNLEEDRPGSLLAGRYRLERIAGRGASAVVWEATHVLTSKTVALKIFVAGQGTGLSDERRRDRSLREARAASRTRHEHVLAIDDVLDLEDGRIALVMPLLVGESLRERLARVGTLSVADACALFAPVVDALARAHEAGVVHRDLKPDNLFVTRDPTRLVVLDFGIAKIVSDGDLGLTSTGVTVGTPLYMAPEQLFGEDDVDARADVWALGVVLHECLAGVRPTEATNLGQLLKKISARALPPLPSSVAPGAPGLVACINEMMAIEREARPSLEALQEALRTPFVEPFEPPRDAPVVADEDAPALDEASSLSPRVSRGGRALAISVGIGFLVAGGGVALGLFRRPPTVPAFAPSAATSIASAAPSLPAGVAVTSSAESAAAAPVVGSLAAIATSTGRSSSAPSVVALRSTVVPPIASSAKNPAVVAPVAVSSPPPAPRIVETAPF